MTNSRRMLTLACSMIVSCIAGCGCSSRDDSQVTELQGQLEKMNSEVTELKAKIAKNGVVRPEGSLSPTDDTDFANLDSSVRRGSATLRELEAMSQRIDSEVSKSSGALAEPEKLASNFVTWNQLVNVIGTNFEPGTRVGNRFMLKSGRIMLLERLNALDVFFAPDALGTAAVSEFIGSDLFDSNERERLRLITSNHQDAQTKIGRFRLTLSSTGEADRELPRYWLRLSIELLSSNPLPLERPFGAYSSDQLYTESRFAGLNRRIRELLSGSHTPDEVNFEVRRLNNLAEGAGVSSNQTLALLENRLSLDAPKVAVTAMGGSLAFRIGIAKDNLNSWRNGTVHSAPDTTRPADSSVLTDTIDMDSPFRLR